MTLPALEAPLEGLRAGILPQRHPSVAPQNRHCPHPEGAPFRSWDSSPDLADGELWALGRHLLGQLLKIQAGGLQGLRRWALGPLKV